jgi:hypothetical protein
MPVVPVPTRTRATLAPAAPVGHVAPGAGRLEFTRVGGRTVLTRVLSCSPLKLLHPRQANRSASVLRDLLVVNKTDLAALVGADLDVMARDARTMRGDGPVIFAQVIHGTGVPQIVEHVVGAWQRALSAAV